MGKVTGPSRAPWGLLRSAWYSPPTVRVISAPSEARVIRGIQPIISIWLDKRPNHEISYCRSVHGPAFTSARHVFVTQFSPHRLLTAVHVRGRALHTLRLASHLIQPPSAPLAIHCVGINNSHLCICNYGSRACTCKLRRGHVGGNTRHGRRL
jgi:hypothetical protein